MKNKLRAAIKFLSFLFTWVTGLEIGYIKKSDFFHSFNACENVTRRDIGYPVHMYRMVNVKSWYRAISFFRGAGYCHWLFGRRIALRGFTIKIGRNLMKYGQYNHRVNIPVTFQIYKNGNAGHMTAGY